MNKKAIGLLVTFLLVSMSGCKNPSAEPILPVNTPTLGLNQTANQTSRQTRPLTEQEKAEAVAENITPPTTPSPWPPPITDPAQARPRTFPKSDPPPVGIGGWKQPRPLTDAEKAQVIEIALNSTQVKNWLNGNTDYGMGGIYWFAITWNNGTMSEYACPGYDDVINNGIPSWVSPYAWWYPAVTLWLGPTGSRTQTQMAIDLDNGKLAFVDGPYPPPGQIAVTPPK